MTTGEIIALIKAFGGGGGGSSGGGSLKIGVTVTQSGDETTYTLEKTWRQIVDAVNGGVIPYICMDIEGGEAVRILAEYYNDETNYSLDFGTVYFTTSENGYPSYSEWR